MTTNKPEVVGFATHHDEPMLLPSKGEATIYCDDGDEPVALIRLSDYEALQAELQKLQSELTTVKKVAHGNIELLEENKTLQAECEKLRQQVETFQGLKPAMPPRPPTGEGLPRYGLRWNGPSQPLSVPMDDGYWTPWHLAQGECEKLRKLVTECADYLSHNEHTCINHGSVLHSKLIDAAMQGDQP